MSVKKTKRPTRKTQSKKGTRKRTTASAPTPFISLPHFLGMLLLIAAIVSIVYFYHKPSVKTHRKASLHKKQIETSFDFYQLLPKIEVPVADSAPTANHSVAPNKQRHHTAYVLQVAAFNQFKDADTLKARLALSGFDVNVYHYQTKQHQNWYRVWIGPYRSKKQAMTDKTELNKQHIQSLLLTVPARKG